MLESIMLIALGFLTATLFALIAIQFVWRRAVKVTTRKLTSDIDLDELRGKADQADALDESLREKNTQVAALSARNTELEGNLSRARREIETLNQSIADLQAEHANLQTTAETRLQDLKALQSHVEDIDAALRVDFEKRGVIENQLKSIGAKTLQLLEEMNGAVKDFTDTKNIQALLDATPRPTEIPEKPEAPAKLTPLVLDPAEDTESADLVELEEIKASLDQGVTVAADTDDDDDEAPSATSETYIADRIRALEAGVNAPA
ncbi:MAG: hypothetical protein WA138_13505 [Parvibaculum sp.]